uniref:Uncharacterized protein n=1 Tax=Myotis myotis TaxID=51298 RepID=A0A7J8ANW1_MYOMY|nr:hypothetical protein mMyoMyo1_008215 [Myotis myotis]
MRSQRPLPSPRLPWMLVQRVPGSHVPASSLFTALLHPASTTARRHWLPHFSTDTDVHPKVPPGYPLDSVQRGFDQNEAPPGICALSSPPCAPCKGEVGCEFRKPKLDLPFSPKELFTSTPLSSQQLKGK